MKWIAITGGIASGKSRVAQYIRSLGHPVVSADQLARELSQPGGEAYSEILQAFGSMVLAQDQSIDRKQLGALVFKDKERLRELEGILHPLIQKKADQIRKELQLKGHLVAFYEVPLLFEKNLAHRFDQILLVVANEQAQIDRLGDRDHLSHEEALLRIKAQMPADLKRSRSNFVIENTKTLLELDREVDQVLQKILAQE